MMREWSNVCEEGVEQGLKQRGSFAWNFQESILGPDRYTRATCTETEVCNLSACYLSDQVLRIEVCGLLFL